MIQHTILRNFQTGFEKLCIITSGAALIYHTCTAFVVIVLNRLKKEESWLLTLLPIARYHNWKYIYLSMQTKISRSSKIIQITNQQNVYAQKTTSTRMHSKIFFPKA